MAKKGAKFFRKTNSYADFEAFNIVIVLSEMDYHVLWLTEKGLFNYLVLRFVTSPDSPPPCDQYICNFVSYSK